MTRLCKGRCVSLLQRERSRASGSALFAIAVLVTCAASHPRLAWGADSTNGATSATVLAPSSSPSAVSHSSDGEVPDVAHRLWHDLLCTCSELDCSHEPLEDCSCKYAVKEREKILKRVRILGFGSPKQDELTYAKVLQEYVALHGPKADRAREDSKGRWGAAAIVLGVVIAVATALIWLAQRNRHRPVATRQPQHHAQRGKRKRKARKR